MKSKEENLSRGATSHISIRSPESFQSFSLVMTLRRGTARLKESDNELHRAV